ncbi:ATP-binding response regulator [Lignipirellula cremea]|uniref:Transcriptional regulatory protein ZraR n=1 Tax=Lignipirellula cremea TaxID=2528010 RepID=A0A518DRK0_9BACT|nr:response regulator [Lignipirellula cremea]QDU94462.1 Transcriptional regulatory protein ZraR [Lignipirellula cremea]
MDHPALIVVAEDNRTQATRYRLILEKHGYRVVLAENGRTALDAVVQQEPALLLTDLHMPEMDGLELVVAARRAAPQVPIILTTAGSEQVAVDALHGGAATFISKSRSPQDLLETIERVLAVAAVNRDSHGIIRFVSRSEVEYVLLNDNALAPAVIGKIQQQISEMGVCGPSELMQIGTAVDEALVNAIVHGNLEVPSSLREVDDGMAYLALANQRRHEAPFASRRVYVNVHVTRDEANITVRDEGPGFDPSKIPDPTNLDRLDQISGRGLFLINAFMDSVSHNDSGNQIRMTKRRCDVPPA